MLFVMTDEGRKDKLLQVRVSTGELEALKAEASALGRPVSQLVRERIGVGRVEFAPDYESAQTDESVEFEGVTPVSAEKLVKTSPALFRCPSFPMCGFKTQDGKAKCPKHRRPVVPVS